jgi:hypothetical protein
MQREIDELVRFLGITPLQAYRQVRDRREILRNGKVPPPRYLTRDQ